MSRFNFSHSELSTCDFAWLAWFWHTDILTSYAAQSGHFPVICLLLELEYGCGWDACAAISGPPTHLTNRCVVIWNSCSASITSLHQLLHFINLHYILAKATICLKWGANQTERSGDTELHSRLCVRTRLTFFEPERCVQWRCRVWRRVKMRWRRDVNSMRHRIKCMH